MFGRFSSLLPKSASTLGSEDSIGMLGLDVLPKISHTFSWPQGRGMKFFSADRAAGNADVCVGHRFQKYFLFHACIVLDTF